MAYLRHIFPRLPTPFAHSDGVVIRTNSAYTTVTVDAANSVVTHYGSANAINITAVAMSSYHENGSVATLNVKAGKIAVESNAFVGKVAVASSATASTVIVQNNGTIFATEVVTYTVNETTGDVTTEEYTGEATEANTLVDAVETTTSNDTIKIGTVDALINLANAQSQGLVVESLKLELTADINLTGKNWVPFGADLSTTEHHAFNGTIDGKYHSIIGLSNALYQGVQIANGTTGQIGEHYGFIANAGTVSISNLTFKAVDINSDTATVCAAVIAYASASNITLNNVKVEGNITGADKVAGLVGYAKENATVTISNCTVNANLTAHEYRIGGLLGFVSGSTITVNNTSFGGNIVAENRGNTKTYIAALGSIHATDGGTTTVSVNGFTVSNTAQVQSATADKKVTQNNVVILAIMSGVASYNGITNYVIDGSAYSVSLQG